MSKNGRIRYLDLVKGIAIFLVCIGHAYYIRIGNQGGVTLINSLLRPIIYSFHMPLFILLCGFFSTRAYQMEFGELFKKKFVQLIVPVLTCMSLSLGMHFLSGHVSLELIGTESIAMLWFLKVLFACYLVVYFFLKITKGNDGLACLLSLLIVFLIPYSEVNSFNWYLLIFWLGIFWRKNNDHYINKVKGVTLISALIFLVFLCLGRVTYSGTIRWDLILQAPLQYLIHLMVALSGSFMVIGTCYLLEKQFEKSWLTEKTEWIGQYSLGIFVTQYIVLEGFCKKFLVIDSSWIPNIRLYDFFLAPAIGILACILCFHLTRLLRKNRYINYLMFGNQY
jgi:membrane protein